MTVGMLSLWMRRAMRLSLAERPQASPQRAAHTKRLLKAATLTRLCLSSPLQEVPLLTARILAEMETTLPMESHSPRTPRGTHLLLVLPRQRIFQQTPRVEFRE